MSRMNADISSLLGAVSASMDINQDGCYIRFSSSESFAKIQTQVSLWSAEMLSAVRVDESDRQLTVPHFLAARVLSTILSDISTGTLIDMALNSMYISQGLSRSELIAVDMMKNKDACDTSEPDVVALDSMSTGVTPKTAMVKFILKAPAAISDPSVSQQPVRLVLLLDKSGSMGGTRLQYLKEAVIETVRMFQDKISKGEMADNIYLTILFYDSRSSQDEQYIDVQCSQIDMSNLIAYLNAVHANGGTSLSTAIEAYANIMRDKRLLDHPDVFANSTCVIMTDGADQSLYSADNLTACFEDNGFLSVPPTVAVGVGDYNQSFLNGIAEDDRFGWNAILHISSAEKTKELFSFLLHLVGSGRVRMTVAVSAEGAQGETVAVTKDLKLMQHDMEKAVVLHLPLELIGIVSLHFVVVCDLSRLLYKRVVPNQPLVENRRLHNEYFETLKSEYITAKMNNPDAAEGLLALALQRIPATASNRGLIALRQFFEGESDQDCKVSLRALSQSYGRGAAGSAYGIFARGGVTQQAYSTEMQREITNTSTRTW